MYSIYTYVIYNIYYIYILYIDIYIFPFCIIWYISSHVSCSTVQGFLVISNPHVLLECFSEVVVAVVFLSLQLQQRWKEGVSLSHVNFHSSSRYPKDIHRNLKSQVDSSAMLGHQKHGCTRRNLGHQRFVPIFLLCTAVYVDECVDVGCLASLVGPEILPS